MKLTGAEIRWLSGILRQMKFFSSCTVGEIEDFVGIASKKNYPKGKVIIRQGEYGSFFFVISRGKVSVWAAEENTERRKVATLKPGDYFGETALVERKERNATVITDSKCDLFLFYSGDFLDLLGRNPDLEKRFHAIADERSAERDSVLAQPRKGFFRKLLGID